MKSRIRLVRCITLVSVLLILLLCLTACQESTSSKYERANKLLTEGKYTEAATIFDEISTYEDASKMSLYTKAINAAETGDYETAFTTFVSLGDFKDSSLMITYYKGRQNEASGNAGTEILEDKWFEAIEIFESIPLFRDSKDRAEDCRNAVYEAALAKETAGELDAANAIFLKLGNYKDSAERAYKLYYDEGLARREAGDWDGARAAFIKAGEYSDAPEQIKETTYQKASALEMAGNQEGAYSLFIGLGEYKDSFERANKPYYELGVSKRNSQEWDAARAAFEHAGMYNDASEQIKETTYQEASALEAAGDQEGAYSLFISLGEYKDSFERANKPYYELGVSKRNSQEWDAARAAFKHAGTYSDAEEQIKATYYAEGVAKQKEEDWDAATKAFRNAGDYSDAQTQISETEYLRAKVLMSTGDYAGAAAVMNNLKGYKDVDTLLEEDENLVAAAAAIAREAKLAPYRKIGSVVIFGNYPQTEAGTDQTPIEWIVLDYDVANHKTLLISKYGLDAVPYNKIKTDITWEQCTLRTWLNDEFLNKAFSVKEQSAILITNVDNSLGQGYSGYNTDGGNNTQDQIFLLSYAEANRYLSVTRDDKKNTKSRVNPTAYAISQEAGISDINQTADGKPAGWWWLRSSGSVQEYAANVYYDGSVFSYYANSTNGVVRPAFWINLASDIF